jgi:hypothetical protein
MQGGPRAPQRWAEASLKQSLAYEEQGGFEKSCVLLNHALRSSDLKRVRLSS